MSDKLTMEIKIVEQQKTIARLTRELEEANKDAAIIRKIREIRKWMPIGTPCGCEFDENDECLKRCALHDEVYKKLEQAEKELAAEKEESQAARLALIKEAKMTTLL